MGNYFTDLRKYFNEGWNEENNLIDKLKLKKHKELLFMINFSIITEKEVECAFCLEKSGRGYGCNRCDTGIVLCEECFIKHQYNHKTEEVIFNPECKIDKYIGNNMDF